MNEDRGPALIALRPEPGLSATIAKARTIGLDVQGTPLFEIRARQWEAPDPSSVDALLIGSANAFAHGGAQLRGFADKPVHAVGAATARAACEAGFAIASEGAGGLQSVLEGIAPPARLLRLAGAKHVPLDPPAGISILTRIAYESAPLPMPRDCAELLVDGALVLLHSAEAARHFARECDRLGIARTNLRLAALAPRIAEGAGKGWQSVHVAPSPADDALLAMAANLVT